MVNPTDGDEARRAIRDAERKLSAQRARQPEVDSLVRSLSSHLEENHFAERLAAAFGRTK